MTEKKTIFTLLLLILIPSLLIARNDDLLTSRRSSEQTYIYKISDKEAKKIIKKGITEKDSTLFYQLVTTYPTDSLFDEKLPSGHYLKTCSEKNRQEIVYAFVPEFEAFVVNNNTDLRIQVYDLRGNIIENAQVKVGSKKLKFDKKTKCYTIQKSNRKGFVEITYRDEKAFYKLDREIDYSAFRKGAIGLFYRSPLKYVWHPIDFTMRIPADGINSIRHNWAQGTIRSIKVFFGKIFNPSDYSHGDKYTGYLEFNKPKYLPGDTVKFKAFVVNKKGKPLNKTVSVILYNMSKKIQLTELNPYRPGAYEYQFFLHDSLELKLDKSYSIRLQNKKQDDYISSSFHYEEYELNHAKLTLNAPELNQFEGEPFSIFAKGTDDNDLNLMDARLEIVASAKKVHRYINESEFIPNILWEKEMQLKPTGETEIIVPDSAFPKANFTYDLTVKLLTSDNKTYSQTKTINYYSEQKKINLKLVNDSISIEYVENNKPVSKQVKIHAADNFRNKTEIGTYHTPAKIPLNVYYATYTAQVDSIRETFRIASQPSLLQSYSNRTSDSVFIDVSNPRNLRFTYNIYKRNSEKQRGYTDSLTIKKHTGNKENYYLAIQYLWGGKITTENYKIPFHDKKLNIDVSQPRLVYPGQKADIEISVTDQQGKPVENVDLTAYAFTKKFDYNAPTLPYLGKAQPEKKLINNFRLKSENESSASVKLNYPAWKVLADIDSIEYYKFIYPEQDIYRYEYKTTDKITQFAPFVFKDGEIEPVFVIYVDRVPVYFDWTTTEQPYSFRVDSGSHNIELRLRDRIVKIDNIEFKKGLKTILSFNYDQPHKDIKWLKAQNKLSEHEQNVLNNYIFLYRNNFNGNFALIENNNNIILLNPAPSNYFGRFTGPVAGLVNFSLLDGYEQRFRHEPGFEYDISHQLLKMREIKPEGLPTKHALSLSRKYSEHTFNGLSSLLGMNGNKPVDITDTVLTRDIVKEEKQHMLELKRQAQIRYRYPTVSEKGKGTLIVEKQYAKNSNKRMPLNTLLLRNDDEKFIRVYPGNINIFFDLDAGSYRLIIFFNGSYYHVDDSIRIQTNGTNFRRLQIPIELKKDSFSIKVNKLIDKTILLNSINEYRKNSELGQIYSTYRAENSYTGDGEVISGTITDSSGEPLIGVSVLVKGTTYGTMTDLDGQYSIKVPRNNYLLTFSYVGFENYEMDIRKTMNYDVALQESMSMLEEVVVIGYGVQQKKSLTGAVSTVTTTNVLAGRAAGVIASSVPGASDKVWIRGVSSLDSGQQPLYVIDGQVFTGDISSLNLEDIENFEVLKDASATGIYGARAANGVVIISTKGNAFKEALTREDKGADYDESFLEAASQANSIRNNFSDYAYWQPRLTTDKQGKAKFEVTFPDDVTNWQTYVLAMNSKKQTGQTSGNIKSFKPLMAQLSTPNFLIRNDRVNVLGKSLNYLPDSVKITTNLALNGEEILTNNLYLKNSRIDSTYITVDSDSVNLRYTLQKEDGYFDGEERAVPVYPIGLEQAKGNFYILDKDTVIKPEFDSSLGKVKLYADADYLDVLGYEVNRLISYRYECNEQLASKLIGLLSNRLITIYKGEKPKGDKQIRALVRQIIRNRNEDGLWGWWNKSGTHYPFSMHILNALEMAKQQGFANDIKIDKNKILMHITYELEKNKFRNPSATIQLLKLTHKLDSTYIAAKYIHRLDTIKKLTLNERLNLIELKQLYRMDYDKKTLTTAQDTTLFGNIYYTDKDKRSSSMFDSDIMTTLTAYRIIRNEDAKAPLLNKIRLYLLETKLHNCWWNTYEAGQILETILPDILKPGEKWEKAILHIEGTVNKKVEDFPFELNLSTDDNISIRKTGHTPVYLTTYQHIWNENPEIKNSEFEINTRFEDNETVLKQGKATKLIVGLNVKRDADYVLINVPIPAGCSYTSKKQFYRNEVHREYFKNETVIFCQRLNKGNYKFEVELTPRFSGSFTLNPAKAELMYFPTFNGNNEIRKVDIR